MATSDHFARGGCSNFWGRQFDWFFLVVLKDKKKTDLQSRRENWRVFLITFCGSVSVIILYDKHKLIICLTLFHFNENKRLFDSVLKISKKKKNIYLNTQTRNSRLPIILSFLINFFHAAYTEFRSLQMTHTYTHIWNIAEER